MSTRRVFAFLRAINVGGRTVRMEELRRAFESLGYGGVESFIASGNIVFDAPRIAGPRLEGAISAGLERSLGYPVAAFVRTEEELAAVAGYQPFARRDMDAHTVHVGFLSAPLAAPSSRQLLALRCPSDDLHVHGREIYWLCRTRFSESSFARVPLDRKLGIVTTLRNVNTVKRLAAKYLK
jgi:uncharacterized protein (DUF1697 family)